MNKAELVDLMASTSKMTKTQCKLALETFIDVVTKTLKKGKNIVLTGFGTYSVVNRKRRTGVNPSTGKKMEIPAKKVPKFRAGKTLKEAVKA